MNDNTKLCSSDATNLGEITLCKSKGHANFEAMRFCFGHVALTVTGRMTEACGSLTVVGLRDQAGLCVYCWCQTLEGVVSPHRAITREQPDYNMMPQFFSTATNILLTKRFGARATTSESLPPPVAKMRVLVFVGDWACEIELRQTGVICFPWRQRSWSCGVFKSWISNAHCPFQWKWQVLHNYDISVLQQVGMFFDGIACLMKVWPLFKREFPRVPMTWRSARASANFKCDVADVNK